MHLAGKNDIEGVSLLLEYNADINSKNEDGVTPLIHTSLCGKSEMVSFLLKKGALVNEISLYGTALICCCKSIASMNNNPNQLEI